MVSNISVVINKKIILPRLRAGWSSRAQSDNLASINETEQAIITQVLERANKAQEIEEERVR